MVRGIAVAAPYAACRKNGLPQADAVGCRPVRGKPHFLILVTKFRNADGLTHMRRMFPLHFLVDCVAYRRKNSTRREEFRRFGNDCHRLVDSHDSRIADGTRNRAASWLARHIPVHSGCRFRRAGIPRFCFSESEKQQYHNIAQPANTA